MSQPKEPYRSVPPKPKASVVKYKAELRKAVRRNAAEPEVNSPLESSIKKGRH